MAPGRPLQHVNSHLFCCLQGKHSARTNRQILRPQVQCEMICTTYKSTESSFPSRHSSQTENIPQDGQAHCCHPQGIEGTGGRKRGSYRLRRPSRLTKSGTMDVSKMRRATPPSESNVYNKQSWKWVSLSSSHQSSSFIFHSSQVFPNCQIEHGYTGDTVILPWHEARRTDATHSAYNLEPCDN